MICLDLKMPSACIDCPCYADYAYCKAADSCLDDETYDYNYRRPDWCPLREV